MFTINNTQKNTLCSVVKLISKNESYVLADTIYMEVISDSEILFRVNLDFKRIANVYLYDVIHTLETGFRTLVSTKAICMPNAFSFDVFDSKTIAYFQNGSQMSFLVYELSVYPVMKDVYISSEYFDILLSKVQLEMIYTRSKVSFNDFVFTEKGQFCFSNIAFSSSFSCVDFEQHIGAEISDILRCFSFGDKVQYDIILNDIMLKNTDLQNFKIIWQIPDKKVDKKAVQCLLKLPDFRDIDVDIEPNVIKSLLAFGKEYKYVFTKIQGFFHHCLQDIYTKEIVVKIKASSQPNTNTGFAFNLDILKKLLNLKASKLYYSSKSNNGTTTSMPILVAINKNDKVLVSPANI